MAGQALTANTPNNKSPPKSQLKISQAIVLWFHCPFLGLPFSVYREFVLEQKHGFNKQTPSFYAKDQIKKFVIGQLIQSPILVGVIKIIYWGGDYFFIYLWLFVVLMTLFLMTVYPDLIAPLFDKYTPMPDGQLKYNPTSNSSLKL